MLEGLKRVEESTQRLRWIFTNDTVYRCLRIVVEASSILAYARTFLQGHANVNHVNSRTNTDSERLSSGSCHAEI